MPAEKERERQGERERGERDRQRYSVRETDGEVFRQRERQTGIQRARERERRGRVGKKTGESSGCRRHRHNRPSCSHTVGSAMTKGYGKPWAIKTIT